MGKKSTTTTKPSKFARPGITAAVNASQNAYNTNQANIQSGTDMVTGLLPTMVDKYKEGNAAVNAANDYATNMLTQGYNANPYLDQVLAQSNNEIKNQVQAALGAKGLTGGSDYAGILANKIAQNTLNTRYSDYNNWQNLQAQAAGLSPSLAAADVIQVAPMLSTLQSSLTPLQASGTYANSIGGLLGNYTTQTQSGNLMSTLGNIMGNAAQIGSAAIMASERRVKRDIRKIGEEPDGLGIYEYNYVWDAKTVPVRNGVMVDEVEKLRPWALGPVVDGIQTVNYGAL